MNAIFTIARRETAAYFSNPIGWICLVLFSLLAGLFFSIMLIGYASQASEMGNMARTRTSPRCSCRGCSATSASSRCS
jgi:ABC-type transport system involved in multi-copper enzyme maturation permease subunit